MAYLGRGLDKISNIEVLDNITFDGSSSYSITKGSVAFTPNSAQSLLISIDGVVQATNFSVNSSTIDFGVAIPSTSVCNFFLHYGTGVMTVPSDGSVTTAKLGDNAVSSAKMFSSFKNGITEADMFRLTADLAANADPISANLERVDDASFSKIGTGVTVSSGIFSFPKTGIYLVMCNGLISGSSANDNIFLDVKGTTDNSTYDELSRGAGGLFGGGSVISTMFCQTYFDVTDITTHKIQFKLSSLNSGNIVRGDTARNETIFTFIRLGDT